MSKYKISNLLTLLRNPTALRGVLIDAGIRANSLYYEFSSHNGESIHSGDWDILIILDACRYDTFRSVCDIEGDLSKMISVGSDSYEFIQGNFNETMHNVVYVTANPFVSEVEEELFHNVINVFDTGWNSDLGTVPPEAMVEEVQYVANSYPNKKIIAHFMQPHAPFIGPTGRRISQEALKEMGTDGAKSNTDANKSVWTKLKYRLGKVDSNKAELAYQENLALVLDAISNIIKEITGKVVITSDHGNMFGEKGYPIPVPVYGHPRGIYQNELVDVPWFEIEFDCRRDTQSDPQQSHTIAERDQLESKLEAFGYIND